jgi:hypothetical protein
MGAQHVRITGPDSMAYLMRSECSRYVSNLLNQSMFLYWVPGRPLTKVNCFENFFEAIRSSVALAMMAAMLSLPAPENGFAGAASNSISDELKTSSSSMIRKMGESTLSISTLRRTDGL